MMAMAPVTFFVIKKDPSTERYWLADRMHLTQLLAASFYMQIEDAEKELRKMVQGGQYPKALIVEMEITQKA